MSEIHLAFEAGFRDGLKLKRHISAHEVSERYPEYNSEEIADYLNGLEDGIAGDFFRYAARLVRAQGRRNGKQ